MMDYMGSMRLNQIILMEFERGNGVRQRRRRKGVGGRGDRGKARHAKRARNRSKRALD